MASPRLEAAIGKNGPPPLPPSLEAMQVVTTTSSTAAVAPLRTGTRTRSTRQDLALLALVILAFAALLRLPAFFVDVFNSDETFLATQAQVIQDGGDLYREAADRKPPLVPYVYAATFELFDTNDLWSVRVLAIGAAALTALLVALEARRRYGRRAAWCAGLLCVFALVAFAPQDGQAANFEIFMLPGDDRVRAARAARARGVGRCCGRGGDAREADGRAHARCPFSTSRGAHRGRRGVADALGGFSASARARRCRTRRGASSSTGRCSATVPTSACETASTVVLSSFVLMTIGWIGVQPPDRLATPRCMASTVATSRATAAPISISGSGSRPRSSR